MQLTEYLCMPILLGSYYIRIQPNRRRVCITTISMNYLLVGYADDDVLMIHYIHGGGESCIVCVCVFIPN